MIETVHSPVMLNPLKHHLGYIKLYIKNYNWSDHTRLTKDLLNIGASQMDLYLGNLTLSEVINEVQSFASKWGIIEKPFYLQFIHEQGGYHKIHLSDQSQWILRKGADPQKFIHVHPARHCQHTIRIKATTLKSLIAARVLFGNELELGTINEARELLGLTPVKMLTPKAGIGKMLIIV